MKCSFKKCTVYSLSGNVIKEFKGEPKELEADNYYSFSRVTVFQKQDENKPLHPDDMPDRDKFITNLPFVVEKDCDIPNTAISNKKYIAQLLTSEGEIIEKWECKGYVLIYPPQVFGLILTNDEYVEVGGSVFIEKVDEDKFGDITTEGN